MKLSAKITIALFVTILTLLIDSYVIKGVHILTLFNESVNTIYWSFSVLMLIILSVSFYFFNPSKHATGFFSSFFSFFISVLIAKIGFAVVLTLEDIYRLIASTIIKISHFNTQDFELISRHFAWSYAALFFGLFLLVFVIYGIIFGKYRYKVHTQNLYFDDLPDAFDGFKIVQISDIHSGSFTDAKPIEKAIELINAQGADLFVFTGDLVNNVAHEIEPWIDYFKKIKAPHGQFSILGNHDYGDYVQWPNDESKRHNLNTLKTHHHSMGFKLLLDEHATISKDGHQLKLLGIENWGVGFGQRGDLKKALQGVQQNDFKVLLSHDPSHWDAEVKAHDSHIHLTLSGHTHGMQFGIELFGFKWSPVKYRYKNWAGLTTENNRNLYVNRGFGFLGFRGRVGIWPEITVLHLHKKK